MTTADNNTMPAGGSSVYPPIALATLAGFILYVAADYGTTARQLPMLIGGVSLSLAALDFASRLRGAVGRSLRLTLGAGFDDREMSFRPVLAAELAQIAWLAIAVAGIAFVGILATVPVFTFLYALVHGRWPALHCAGLALFVLALIGVVFEGFLDYALYRGLLFIDDGYN